MYTGLPTSCLRLLRCPSEGGELTIREVRASASPGSIIEGSVICSDCARRFSVSEGILSFLPEMEPLDSEMDHSRRLWDTEAEEYEREVTNGRGIFNAMEIPSTLAALGDLDGKRLLELGCGTGRLTTHLVRKCSMVIAVDFSLAELRIMARKAPAGAALALVHADMTQLRTAPHQFDLALSAAALLALPTRELRLATFRVASEALAPNGRFVLSTHYHGLRNRLAGVTQAGRYKEGGIFRYYSRRDEIAREAGPYFRSVRSRPIQIFLPFAQRLGLPVVTLSRISERIPLVSELGRMLLVTANRPIHPVAEGPAALDTLRFADLVSRYRKRSRRPTFAD